MKKFRGTVDLRHISQNDLDKTCFQHDMDYGDVKDLNRRTFADTVLPDKAFNIVKDPKYDAYQLELASMVYKLFWLKKSLAVVLKLKIFLIKN